LPTFASLNVCLCSFFLTCLPLFSRLHEFLPVCFWQPPCPFLHACLLLPISPWLLRLLFFYLSTYIPPPRPAYFCLVRSLPSFSCLFFFACWAAFPPGLCFPWFPLP
jgi:hypothetical protein